MSYIVKMIIYAKILPPAKKTCDSKLNWTVLRLPRCIFHLYKLLRVDLVHAVLRVIVLAWLWFPDST